MVGSDLAIASAYFSIPLAIHHFVRRRPQLQLGSLPWLFAAFILLCGLTHVISVWTVWRPDYELHAAVKVATAGVSLFTAVMVWRLMPAMLNIPSVHELQAALETLRQERSLRQDAEITRDGLGQALGTALAASGAGFLATDAQGRVVRINAVAESITGWAAHEAIGRSIWEVVRREDRPAELEEMNPVAVLAESGSRRGQPLVCVTRDGLRKPVELSADLTLGDGGSRLGMTVVLRDATRLTKAESEVRRLAAVVNSMSDAVVTKTLDGVITSWNGSAERMFGWTADEIVGESITRLIPPDLLAQEQDLVDSIGRGQAREPFDTWRLRRDGQRVPVSVAVSPILDDLGQVRGVASVKRDLTQLRRVEQSLQVAMDSAKLGAWRYLVREARMEGSDRFRELFGVSAASSGFTMDEMLARLNEDGRLAFEAALAEVVRQQGSLNQEVLVVHEDGRSSWLRVLGGWRDDNGQPQISGICADITQEREAKAVREESERLLSENRRIAEASRLKSLFLANMSHELRTPLNAVIGFADLLKSGAIPENSPKRLEYLGHISRSGHHLLALINDVLDLSKIEAGKLEFTPAAVDLRAFAESLSDEVAPMVHEKSMQFRLEVDLNLGPAWIDPLRLRQVALNYLSNAIKFSPAGAAVWLRIVAEGADHFRLEVDDEGPGISQPDQARLFIEFQQLDGGFSKRHQGTGLGLALTRHLVTAQGGRVGVRSTPGHGSTFFAVLPLRAVASRAAGTRILIAHTQPDVRDRLLLALGRSGAHVDTAACVEDLLALARRHRYDAWVLDVFLRDGPTMEALRLLSGGTGRISPPVNLLSMSHANEAVAFEVTDVLSKPMESGELKAALERLGVQRSCSIMVVDDDPVAREVMGQSLETLGYRPALVSSGAEALAGLDSVRPAAMVLDLMMPDLDGFEVLDALRAHPDWSHLPVLIWSVTRLDGTDYERLAASSSRIRSRHQDGFLQGTLDAFVQSVISLGKDRTR